MATAATFDDGFVRQEIAPEAANRVVRHAGFRSARGRPTEATMWSWPDGYPRRLEAVYANGAVALAMITKSGGIELAVSHEHRANLNSVYFPAAPERPEPKEWR